MQCDRGRPIAGAPRSPASSPFTISPVDYLHAFETGSELGAGLTRWIGYYNFRPRGFSATRQGVTTDPKKTWKNGWGTWIRTKAARVRAGSSTAKLSPNGHGTAG